jgi:3-oxoacyl-[acyl-carrier protein] reductase
MKLDGKVVIVTGASYGIGRAYAHALAAEGATVVASARNVGRAGADGAPQLGSLGETVASGKVLPGPIFARSCDMLIEAEIVRLVDETVANFGRIDMLINNAAIYTHHDTFEIDQTTWDHHVALNLRGPYFAIREVSRHMKRQRSGSVVNITSASAAPTEKGHGGHEDLLLYGITKAGLNRMTHFFAEELKEYGVAVNAISPGAVDTETWNAIDPPAVATFKAQGLVRPCTPEALGGPIIALALHNASTMTGQILHTGEWGKSWN